MKRIIRIVGLFTCAMSASVLGCSGGPDSSTAPAPAPAPLEATPLAHDPTVSRQPTQSKSLTLTPDWQPPSPTRTTSARAKPRVVAVKQYGVPTPTLAPRPSDGEIGAVTLFPEPLRPGPGTSSDAE